MRRDIRKWGYENITNDDTHNVISIYASEDMNRVENIRKL